MPETASLPTSLQACGRAALPKLEEQRPDPAQLRRPHQIDLYQQLLPPDDADRTADRVLPALRERGVAGRHEDLAGKIV